MGSCTPVESWHERMEGRDSEPVVDVTDVSKVWETTGEVAVNSFSMKAFLGEVRLIFCTAAVHCLLEKKKHEREQRVKDATRPPTIRLYHKSTPFFQRFFERE